MRNGNPISRRMSDNVTNLPVWRKNRCAIEAVEEALQYAGIHPENMRHVLIIVDDAEAGTVIFHDADQKLAYALGMLELAKDNILNGT